MRPLTGCLTSIGGCARRTWLRLVPSAARLWVSRSSGTVVWCTQHKSSAPPLVRGAGVMWEEENRVRPQGPKTARTSEGYGEATCSTAEKLIGLLANLTCVVPALAGWDGVWNLNEDASFLDIGSGYGKVCRPTTCPVSASCTWPSAAAPLP
eukprot:4908354-Prymnesium_polylepis.1